MTALRQNTHKPQHWSKKRVELALRIVVRKYAVWHLSMDGKILQPEKLNVRMGLSKTLQGSPVSLCSQHHTTVCTNPWRLGQRALFVMRRKGLLDGNVFGVRLERGEESALEFLVVQHPSPSPGPSMDAASKQQQLSPLGMPDASADEALAGLAVHVVAGVRAFPTCARPGSGEERLWISQLCHFGSAVSRSAPCTASGPL